MIRGALAAVAALMLAAAPAWAERLVTSLSSSRVLIASNYLGAELVLFGAIERDASSGTRIGEYDVIVTARGPRGSVVVREKDRAGPIYLNYDRRKLFDVPSFLAVMSTRPVHVIADDLLRGRLKLGFEPNLGSGEIGEFRRAFIQIKSEQALYIENPKGVTFLTPNLFRATIALPAGAPLGDYEVEARLFSNGASLAEVTNPFEVSKVGFEAFVALEARARPWLYGLSVVGMAMAMGWAANVAFRRD